MLENKVSSNINITRKGNHSIIYWSYQSSTITRWINGRFVVAGELDVMSCGDPLLAVTSRRDESNYNEDGWNDCESNGTDVRFCFDRLSSE